LNRKDFEKGYVKGNNTGRKIGLKSINNAINEALNHDFISCKKDPKRSKASNSKLILPMCNSLTT
jgi:hypothetical protein